MKHLAIGPGALGYFALLGALNKLWDSGSLTDLETLSGSSAGAILCFMIAMTNFDFGQVLELSLKVQIRRLKPVIKSLIQSYGLIPRETIRSLIVSVFPDESGITFAQLYKRFPKVVYISAFCVELTQTHYFSVESHPDMPVIDALCMSVAVPFLFSSFKYGTWHYLDGGSAESSPCGPYLGKPQEDVYILRIEWKENYEVSNFSTYIQMILNSMMKIRYNYDFPTCFVNVGEEDMFDFAAGDSSKQRLFLLGYREAKAPSTFQKSCMNDRRVCMCPSCKPLEEPPPSLGSHGSPCEPLDSHSDDIQTEQDAADPCAP